MLQNLSRWDYSIIVSVEVWLVELYMLPVVVSIVSPENPEKLVNSVVGLSVVIAGSLEWSFLYTSIRIKIVTIKQHSENTAPLITEHL